MTAPHPVLHDPGASRDADLLAVSFDGPRLSLDVDLDRDAGQRSASAILENEIAAAVDWRIERLNVWVGELAGWPLGSIAVLAAWQTIACGPIPETGTRALAPG